MNLFSSVLVAASSAPAVPTGEAAREIGPGFAGFVATAAMVIVVIFLIRDMTRRIRRVRYAGTAEERQNELVERGRERQAASDEFPPRSNPGPDGSIRFGDGTEDNDDGPDSGQGPAR